jgi:hypothetical protein
MRKPILILLSLGLVLGAVSAGGWFYYSRLRDVPPPPERKPQAIRAIARIEFAPQASGASNSASPAEQPPQSQTPVPEIPRFRTSLEPMQEFHQELNKLLLRDLSSVFPDLPAALSDSWTGVKDPVNRHVLFQLLDAAEKAPADKRAEIDLAAELVAQRIGCDIENKTDCAKLRADLARYHLGLHGDELGGVFVYSGDLAWRLWSEYRSTDWGERTFVLLLERGWDTTSTCDKGAEQFRGVIRQGETFLQERPASSQRAVVTLLVAEAYATWWSLSLESRQGMSDYVDPKQYVNGAEEAHTKSISYFEQAAQLAPNTNLAEYAKQVANALRDHEPLDNYRFYCIYD